MGERDFALGLAKTFWGGNVRISSWQEKRWKETLAAICVRCAAS